VLPDADEPVCRVFAESFNQEAAESLTDMYVKKIQDICGQDTGADQESMGRARP